MAKGYKSGYFWLMLSKKVKIVIFKLARVNFTIIYHTSF